MKRLRFLTLIIVLSFFYPAGETLSQSSSTGYAQASLNYQLSFPEDHASHPDFKTEWWYFTGDLKAESRRFGYQFTIFRRRVDTAPIIKTRPWSTDQILTAHLAVSDFSTGEYYHDFFTSRLKRGISSADTTVPGRISLRTAKLEIADTWNMNSSSKNFSLNFSLKPKKGPLLHGKNGYSQKGPEPGQANIYYSYPRMLTDGTLTIEGKDFSVSGRTWFDHEFGSSQLDESQVGWDWLSLRLKDSKDLMLFRLREEDGSISEESAITLRNGETTTTGLLKDYGHFEPDDSEDYWKSPETGTEYPLNWTIKIPEKDIELKIEPIIQNQEMKLRAGLVPSYWEGLVLARKPDGTIAGSGYLELTGYDRSVSGSF